MSRIGKQPITLPSGVTVERKDNNTYEVKGSKGILIVTAFDGITSSQEDGNIIVVRKNDTLRSMHGLQHTLLSNAIKGVAEGWKKELEINGVGMRAAISGNTLTLNVGFSHPVLYTTPDGIDVTINKNIITVSGIDKQLVGEVAAKIRKVKPPEPYKGKGIKYSDETIRRKAGKAGKAA